MSLPKRNSLTYKLVIPSTKQKVSFSPFTVGIQTQLLLAQQSEDMDVMISTLKGTIKECIKEDIDVESLAVFDLEYIFLNIRAKSTDELAELIFPCDICPKDDEKARVKISIDLPTIEVKFPENHTNIIKIDDNLGIKMKYPSASVLNELDKYHNESELMMNIIIDSIDCIFKDDEIWNAKDYSKEELSEFLNSLYKEDIAKLVDFFMSMPKLSKEITYNCPVCNHHHTKNIEGLTSFF